MGAPSTPGPEDFYASCPRCGLRVRVRWSTLAVEHCPRCVARFRRLVQMTLRRRAGAGGGPRHASHA